MVGENKSDELAGTIGDGAAVIGCDRERLYSCSFLADGSDGNTLQIQVAGVHRLNKINQMKNTEGLLLHCERLFF